MTKWTLPEGRKPLTDADIAALTRRLAGTAVDYKELYQAAKRDAEEAEAYAKELEATLAKAVEALVDASQIISQCTWTTMRVNGQYVDRREVVQSYRATLAELTGGKDD